MIVDPFLNGMFPLGDPESGFFSLLETQSLKSISLKFFSYPIILQIIDKTYAGTLNLFANRQKIIFSR